MDNWHNCPLNGSITDQSDDRFHTNELKNRYQAPSSAPFIRLRDLLKATTSSTDFNEDDGATVEGYVGKVIFEVHSRTQNGHRIQTSESCNCNHTGLMDADEHIYLLPTRAALNHYLATNDKSQVVNVETTPRVKELARRAGFTWNKNTLATLKGHKVRFRGWLLNDWEHKGQSAIDGASDPDRGTCWEVHPVTEIEILN